MRATLALNGLIAKLEAYGFDDYLVYCIYSDLDKGKQCVRINDE